MAARTEGRRRAEASHEQQPHLKSVEAKRNSNRHTGSKKFQFLEKLIKVLPSRALPPFTHTHTRMYIRMCTYICVYVCAFLCASSFGGPMSASVSGHSSAPHTHTHTFSHIRIYVHICSIETLVMPETRLTMGPGHVPLRQAAFFSKKNYPLGA